MNPDADAEAIWLRFVTTATPAEFRKLADLVAAYPNPSDAMQDMVAHLRWAADQTEAKLKEVQA